MEAGRTKLCKINPNLLSVSRIIVLNFQQAITRNFTEPLCPQMDSNRPIPRPSRSWSYDSWIYNYLCNQCPSPLQLWVRIPLRRSVLDTTSCDKVCQWIAADWWFSPSTIKLKSMSGKDLHDHIIKLPFLGGGEFF